MNTKKLRLVFYVIFFLFMITLFLFSPTIVSKLKEFHINLIEGNQSKEFYIYKFRIFLFFFFIISIFYSEAFFSFFRNNNFSFLTEKKSFLIFFFLFSLILSVYPRYITGDEVHYLNLSKSIIKEGNFELSEYKEASKGHYIENKEGKLYSIHYPLLSVLISIPYLLGGVVGVKISMGIFWFFCVWIISLILEKENLLNNNMICLSLLFLSSPFTYFSGEIYPELIGAFLLILAFYLIEYRKASLQKEIKIGIIFSLLLWPSIRYYPIVFIFALYYLIKNKKIPFLTALLVSLSFIFQMFLFSRWYDLPLPWAMYKGTGIVSRGNFFRGFFGLFLDQQSGLFVISPLYILIFSAIYLFFKTKKDFTAFFTISVMIYTVLTGSSKYWNGHWSPSSRLWVVFIPFFIILLVFLYSKSKRSNSLTKLFKLLTLFSLWWGYLYNILPDKRCGVYGKEGANFFIHTFAKILGLNLDTLFIRFYNGKIYPIALTLEIIFIIAINILVIKKIFLNQTKH